MKEYGISSNGEKESNNNKRPAKLVIAFFKYLRI